MTETEPSERAEDFEAYYDIAHFRHDLWHQLKQLSARRAELGRREDPDALERLAKLDRRRAQVLDTVEELEAHFAFPGRRVCRQLRQLEHRELFTAEARQIERILRLSVGDLYRRREVADILHEDFDSTEVEPETIDSVGAGGARPYGTRPYFEVLFVDETALDHSQDIRRRMLGMRRESDDFVYDVVVAGTLEDALVAALINPNIQSVVIRYEFPISTRSKLPLVRKCLSTRALDLGDADSEHPTSWVLARALKRLRPELDLFLVTDDPLRNIAGHTGQAFRRVFYHQEDYLELHLSVLRGIQERFDTPFFSALREYSHRPTGVFHALPISRGKSVLRSHWIRDMGEFYGDNIFLAETSATTGGLDSLLQPHGAIKRAQEKAARAFGARRSYFVTNGTSTANKIVVQALMSPGEIALVSRDCHKSHHYALVISGSLPVYMDPYPLSEYTMYGAVPLREVKRHLLELRAAGKLDSVRMVLLTNCTFDGVVYHPERVMREILAIKPDMVFVWDEAWFAFARFTPTYRQRTAMEAAQRIHASLLDPEYRARYQAWRAGFDAAEDDIEAWLDEDLMLDPDAAQVRVYATQSTHKTLTSLRQGSMIHVYDLEFSRLAHEAFEEAYMTHTSTSPNYQILASLDVGRRQVELEGYEMVERSAALAMILRERVQESAQLSRYFEILEPRQMIPAAYRSSGLEAFYTPEQGYRRIHDAYREDEFVLDPTRVTVHVGRTGMDGDTMRNYLMDRHDIQINKTSRNTVLFMLNIGTTRGAVAYLLEVLTQIAAELDQRAEHRSPREAKLVDTRIEQLTRELPPLPNFSRFHPRFRPDGDAPGGTVEGLLREAFFLGRDDQRCDFVALDGAAREAIAAGRELVSASFVTPYPPGFPVLVPGQVISEEILAYLLALDVKEIHGYNAQFGLRVFKQELLDTSTAPQPLRALAIGETP